MDASSNALPSAADLKAQFERDGFVILRGALTPEETARGRAAFEAMAPHIDKNPKDLLSNYYLPHRPDQGVLYDLYQRSPAFAALARTPAIVDGIAAIYGPNFYLYENSLVYKPAGRSNAVHWHQDFMDRPDEHVKVVAWMALDDVTEANGCMYGVPGSHKLGFLKSERVAGETHHTRLVLDGVDLSAAIPLEMKSGDVLLFHQLLVHSSREIALVTNRRAYRVSYQSMDVSYTPRGTPIVISLRDPAVLDRPFADAHPEISFRGRLRRFGHKVVDRLL